MPEDGENATVEQIQKRSKWENDDYVCRGIILNGISGSLVDIYQNAESRKELWDSLEAKYMAEDASSKKFTQHKINMDEAIQVSCIIYKLPPSWNDFKYTLKNKKEELTLVQLGSHLRIEESLRAQDNDKPKGNTVSGPLVVNMVAHNNSTGYNDNKGKCKHQDTKVDPSKKSKVTCWKSGKPGLLKKDCKDGKGDNVAWWVDSGLTVHVCKDRCWFKTYSSLNDGSILHMGNESTALVHRRGCVDLRFSSVKIVSLFNVLHLPNIKKNLVSSTFMSTSKLNDSILWHARLGHVHFKRMQDMSKDGLIPAFDMDTEKCKTCMLTKIIKKSFENVKHKIKVLELVHGDLYDLHATPSLGNRKYSVTFIDDASRFCYVYLLHTKDEALDKFKVFKTKVELQQGSLIKRVKTDRGEPNESVSINSIIKSKDDIFDENRFSSFPRPSQRSLINGTEDTGGSVVPEEVTKQDDPKSFDEAIKSQDVAFWKEAINDEMDSIMGNNTWVLTNLPLSCKPLGCKWIFKRKMKLDGTIEKFKAILVIHGFKQKSGIDYFDTYAPVARINTIRLLIAMTSIHNLIIHQMYMKTAFLNGKLDEEVNLTKKFLSSRFSMKDMGEADIILVSTPMDTSEKFMPNNGKVVTQIKYSRVIGSVMYAMSCTRPDISFDISNTKDNSSTSGWLFLLGGGAISWASKKQTCITSSIMESEFVALAAASKEAEWLRNMILNIPSWSKPIAHISICCDSVATLAKDYSQMYNRKSRHLEAYIYPPESGGAVGEAGLDEFRQRVEGLLEKQEEKLRKLSIEYDEELYPHMLSAIAERRWLISHGLRLAAMSTLESQEVKQSFGDVVKCALARGKAEAVEELHEKKLLTVPAAQVPGYNHNAYEELVAAMEAMKLLELPHIAQLERDQDYPIGVIMAGLTLARHATEGAEAQPDYFLKPDVAQLQVPIFASPRDILNPFALEKEIPLKESLEAHAIRLAKKKGVKGKAILCGVGAAHIPRSDGVPVSVATVSPKDSELLGKLEEAGDAAYQVGRSEQSRCHSV
ncbi:zinc finger, CCHC-type containing protein [Tanacetum coccineum]